MLTRRCLELIDRYEFGVAVQTKSARILRDFDLLTSINEKAKAIVQITLTTYDEDLCKKDRARCFHHQRAHQRPDEM